MIAKSDISSWLREAFQDDNIKDEDWQLEGQTDKGDGYSGDINFLQLHLRNADKIIDLAIKSSKQSEILQKIFPMQEVYYTEIFIYNNVVKEFIDFQKSKNIDPFQYMPKCYGYINKKEVQVLILENLKKKGYSMAARKKPLHRTTIESVLKAYGEFHALSFALKDQNLSKFQELSKAFKNSWWSEVFQKSGFRDACLKNIQDCIDILKSNGVKESLTVKLPKLMTFDMGIKNKAPENPNAVITHGDCWTNNFLFQFEDQDQTKCKDLKILDWQLSRVASPVMDLSYFIFTCISPEDLNDLPTLLQLYHTTLSDHIRKLGSEPEIIYPYSELLREWKKFGIFGAATFPNVVGLQTLDKSECLDFAEMLEKGKDFKEIVAVPTKNEDFIKRVLDIMPHPEYQNVL